MTVDIDMERELNNIGVAITDLRENAEMTIEECCREYGIEHPEVLKAVEAGLIGVNKDKFLDFTGTPMPEEWQE